MKNYDFKKLWALVGPIVLAGVNEQTQTVRDPNTVFWLGAAALALNHFLVPTKPGAGDSPAN